MVDRLGRYRRVAVAHPRGMVVRDAGQLVIRGAVTTAVTTSHLVDYDVLQVVVHVVAAVMASFWHSWFADAPLAAKSRRSPSGMATMVPLLSDICLETSLAIIHSIIYINS